MYHLIFDLMYESFVSLVNDLKMDSYIAANGLSLVYQGKEIYKKTLTRKQMTHTLDQILGDTSMSIELETTKGLVSVQQSDNEVKQENSDKVYIDYDIDEIMKYETYEITVLGEDIKEKLHFHSTDLHAKVVGQGVVNIFPKDISKATAIKKMLEILSYDKSQAIAFGDEENDLEMFKEVDYTVAMGNAVDELKALATYVTDTVDNDGIYKACEYYQLF